MEGQGFVHSPLLQGSLVYDGLLHVSDWYKTLISAALSGDTSHDQAKARAAISELLLAGPIDSVDHWAVLSTGGKGGNTSWPRSEVLLAGVDTDKQGAAIRIGQYKLMVGQWGAGTWCDLNKTGFSPSYPASPVKGIGGEGGLVCTSLGGAQPHSDQSEMGWFNRTFGLFNVEDPN